jgi:glycosyltransferase involved in cell wall biosynthesis
MKTLRILGTRGVPAAHGGFETFAEHLALYLVAHGWRVVVYCQEYGIGPVFEDTWQGVERVHIPVKQDGPKGTIVFDWKSTVHAAKYGDLCLTLGYNTAVFCTLLRLKGVPNLINMDGIEWSRAKWGPVAKTWFWLNDWAGCWLSNHLVADHPRIKDHLNSRVRENKITMIPYGADAVTDSPIAPLSALGLEARQYLTVIARAEPENSLLEIVTAFSRKQRGYKLAILGKYEPENNAYHRAVMEAAGPEVLFLGAIYDKDVVQALRFHSIAYIHGHQVGGTNPSLIEAMGAGNPVIAHDNQYNRWVAGELARYFSDADECSSRLDEILQSPNVLSEMKQGILQRYRDEFIWGKVLSEYEALLAEWLPDSCRRP